MERGNSAAAAAAAAPAGGTLDFCLSGVGCVPVAAPTRARPQKNQLRLSRPPAAAAAAAAAEQRGGSRARGGSSGGGSYAAAAAVPPVPAAQTRQASAASDPSALSVGVLGLMALRDRRRGSADSSVRPRWPASSASVCGSESRTSAAAAAAAATTTTNGAAASQAPVLRGGGGVGGSVKSSPGGLLLNATKLTPAASAGAGADGVSRHGPAPPVVYSVPIEEDDDAGCCGGSDAGEEGEGDEEVSGADAGVVAGKDEVEVCEGASCDAVPGEQQASLPHQGGSDATQVQAAQEQEQGKAHVAAAARTAARRVRVVLAREKVERALVSSKLSEAQTEAAAQRRKARGTAWQWRREVYAYNKLLRIVEAKKSVLYDEVCASVFSHVLYPSPTHISPPPLGLFPLPTLQSTGKTT